MNLLSAVLICAAAAPSLVAGPVETVAEDFQFTEGPVWLPGEGFVFTDIPADTIFRLDHSVFRQPSGKANGLATDNEGRLIACEHWNRRVTRTEKDGTVKVLAESYLGRKLNSPNDLTVRTDGVIFFTDPPYGLESREGELPFSGLYAIMPDGEIRLLSVYFERPNGVALSPDEKTLYVADSQLGFIQAFDVTEKAELRNSRLFADNVGPDGMEVDTEGNLWVAARDGVRVYSPVGELRETIALPHQPTNCAFGGEDGKTLVIAARKGVYTVPCTVAGLWPTARLKAAQESSPGR